LSVLGREKGKGRREKGEEKREKREERRTSLWLSIKQ